MDFTFFSAARYRTFLEENILSIEEALSNAPAGSLKINHFHGQTWYCIYIGGPDLKHTYLPVNNTDLIKALAQKDYNKKILRFFKKALKDFIKYSLVITQDEIDKHYYSLCPERQVLVIPVMPTDRQYADIWLNEPYSGLPFKEDDPGSFYTSDNLRVRSKAEIIIANSLSAALLPFKYEKPLILGSKALYPDFTILDMRTRTEKYFEHFGMMDNPEYVKNFLRKINFYESHGIFPGKELIFTLESGAMTLDTRILKALIKKHFFSA